MHTEQKPKMGEVPQTPHIVILPSPGMGHLIPLLKFAKRLTSDFSFTFTIPSDCPPSKAQKSVLDSLPSSINFIFLPPVNFDDLPDDTRAETWIALTVTRSLPMLRQAIEGIVQQERVVALLVDLFGTDGFDVAKEFNLPSYIFYPWTAMELSFFLAIPILDEKYSTEYRDVPEMIELPGCVPLHGRDLGDPMQDRKGEAYKWLMHHLKRYALAEGILVNSFIDLEPGAFKFLTEEKVDRPPVYPVGPLIQTGKINGSDPSGCLKWLDSQPSGSVLFISFGSGGTLSTEQLTELAYELEMSEQRFSCLILEPSSKVVFKGEKMLLF